MPFYAEKERRNQAHEKTAAFLVLILLAGALSACQSESGSASSDGKTVQLLNVSYDPTRELYKEYNQAFSSYWKRKRVKM